MTKSKLGPRLVRYGGAMYGEEEIDRVNAVLADPMGLIPGKFVSEFEQRVAGFMGKKHGVMVNSGSSALLIAMRLLDLPEGSEVITPALTFSSDVAAIYQAGYKPVFVDVGLSDYQILVDRVEDVVAPSTRALLVPDLVGGIGDWDRLRAIADRHGLMLVQDSADTPGQHLARTQDGHARGYIHHELFDLSHHHRARQRRHGVLRRAGVSGPRPVAARLGPFFGKNTCSARKLRESDGRFLERLDGVDYDSLFIFEDLAYGFIPNEAGAAFGIGQMNRIEELWALRNERFARYYEFFKRYSNQFIVPTALPETETTWICFPVQINPATGWNRRALQIHLEDNGVFSRVIFSGNITRHPMLKGREFRVHPEGLANCDRIMENGIMLPCHPTMTKEDCDYVEQLLESFIEADGAP